MDARIDNIARTGSALLSEYLDGVITASGKLVEKLVRNAETLVRDVVKDGVDVARAACEVPADDGEDWQEGAPAGDPLPEAPDA